MKRNITNKLLVAGLIVFGLVAMVTGVIKFSGLHGYLNFLLIHLPARLLNTAHDWSGVVAVVFALAVIIGRWLVRKRAAATVKPAGSAPGDKTWLWALFGLALLVAVMTAFNYQVRPNSSEAVRQLKTVEVREYQGEKLSSVADIPDNSITGPQYVDVGTYKLEISGLVDSPQKLTYAEVLDRQKYSKVVDLHCVEGWSAKLLWEGVLVRDLLAEAGVRPEAKAVIFHAADGYTSALPLDFFEKNDILLGSKMNGVTLLPERGFPFQLVAEDKWGYKWVKWVTQIELSDDVNYRGTWESRGYNNAGDASGPKFEP
jgi:DMSO/TMAO reductase YedYZ molybdopterin-dependent catalytic subunit